MSSEKLPFLDTEDYISSKSTARSSARSILTTTINLKCGRDLSVHCIPASSGIFRPNQPAHPAEPPYFYQNRAITANFSVKLPGWHGKRQSTLEGVSAPPIDIENRQLSLALKPPATAQATSLYDGTYRGPALRKNPHGHGTVTWPDNCRLVGVFEHGEITGEAVFFFQNGNRFLGHYRRGRPYRQGVLLDFTGKILFAGNFIDEQPNGVGLRSAADGPEFCLYTNGLDQTKSLRRRAQEAIDFQDWQRLQALWDPIVQLERETGTWLALHRQKAFIQQAQMRTEQDKSRYGREVAAAGKIRASDQKKIEDIRQWCAEALNSGKRPCICAPLSVDFDHWPECSVEDRLQYIVPDPFSAPWSASAETDTPSHQTGYRRGPAAPARPQGE
jgi:hypothetical protein